VASAPGLAVIVAGSNQASALYIRNQDPPACAEVGIHSEVFRFGEDVSERELLGCIRELNLNPAIHGISGAASACHQASRCAAVLETIDVGKDVDGLPTSTTSAAWCSAIRCSRLVRPTVCRSCSSTSISSLRARTSTVVGASNIVRKPMALMLMQREATVAICHAKTPATSAQYTILADIVVVAARSPQPDRGAR